MARVRMIAEATVRDYEGAIGVINRVARYVQENLPGTLAWDCYTDGTGEYMIWYEEFADEKALLEYEAAMTDLGIRQEIGRFTDLDCLTILGPVSDPKILQVLGQFDGEPMRHALGAHRDS